MPSRRILLIITTVACLTSAIMAAAPFTAAQGARGAVALNGHDWQRLGPAAREAYLSGFIAGAATHQALRGRTATSGTRAAGEAARLKQSDALTFPLAENVYRSHLDDYYFYHDRRTHTLIQAIVDLNSQIRNGR